MTLKIARSSTSAAYTKGEDAAEIARPLQNLKQCKYCDFEHFDDFHLKFHEEIHKQYYEEREIR